MKSLDDLLEKLELDPKSGVLTIGADVLGDAHFPPLNPDCGTILLDFNSPAVILQAKKVLDGIFPADHSVLIVETMDGAVRKAEISTVDPEAPIIALYIPPLGVPSSFEGLQETVAHLRAPEGCPWDREQTHATLRKHLLEEAYEVLEAIDRERFDDLREELGDLLLQVLMNAQVAYEDGRFRITDVIAGIQEKLIHRHPHVFGDMEVSDVDQVLTNWEHFKRAEKDDGPLDGVPRSLPGLAQAAELQDRAARAGFKWPSSAEALAKVHEELTELEKEPSAGNRPFELGDLLFAVVNYARWITVDAEAEIRRACDRFRLRFYGLDEAARARNASIADLDFEEMMRMWEDTKGLSA